MAQMSNDHVRCVQKDHVAKKKKKKKLYDKYIYPKELSKIVLFPQIYEYFFIDTSTGIYKIKSILPALKTNKWPLEIGICLLCSEVHSRWFRTDWERALKSKAGVCSAPFLLFAARAGQERCTGVEKMCGSTHVGGTSVHTHKQVTSNYPLPRAAETPPWNQRCSPRTGLVSPNSKALKRCLTGPAGHLVQLLPWPRHRLELQHMHPSPPQLMNPQLSSLLPCSSATISRKKEQTCLFSKRVL